MSLGLRGHRAGNLPVDVNTFVGRRREATAVRSMMSSARLITLTGLGGVGKTRLAIKIGSDLHRAFPDGVWLVELAGLHDPGLVEQTVASSLGVRYSDGKSSPATLTEILGDRHLLLILDNCEHLIDACAVFAAETLAACPNIRLLATSRQLLHIPGEHSLAVPPLSTPEADHVSSPEQVERYESVRLFAQRAGEVHPAFAIGEHNYQAIAAVCNRLDGIPLAIELAASRTRTLTPQQLLERLDDRFELLTGGSRVALPRQQTLRALIDWSFELCSPAERLLWARAAVFVDGFGLDAAEAVCADDELPVSEIVDLLSGLVDKSVLGTVEVGSDVRYKISETLREYGRQKLADIEQTDRFRRRARDWCVTLVSETLAQWLGSKQPELLARLRLEHGNIRAALDYCASRPDEAESGLFIAASLRYHWLASGRIAEGTRWLNRLLEFGTEWSPVRAKALCAAGFLAVTVGDFERADDLISRAHEQAEWLGDAKSRAYVSEVRGVCALFQHRSLEAITHLAQAVDGYRIDNDQAAIAHNLTVQAWAEVGLGNDARAEELQTQCLAITDALNEHWVRATSLWTLGIVLSNRGEFDRAMAAERQSIELRLALGSRFLLSQNVDVLGWIAVASGDAERAATLFGAAHAIQVVANSFPVSNGPTADLHERHVTQARAALGDVAFELAFDRGTSGDFDGIVNFILGYSPGVPVKRLVASSGVSGIYELTPREREIAQLVAEGFTNRQIANTLVIAQRTAEGHVQNILTKLGLQSRTQIASHLVECRQAVAE